MLCISRVYIVRQSNYSQVQVQLVSQEIPLNSLHYPLLKTKKTNTKKIHQLYWVLYIECWHCYTLIPRYTIAQNNCIVSAQVKQGLLHQNINNQFLYSNKIIKKNCIVRSTPPQAIMATYIFLNLRVHCILQSFYSNLIKSCFQKPI